MMVLNPSAKRLAYVEMWLHCAEQCASQAVMQSLELEAAADWKQQVKIRHLFDGLRGPWKAETNSSEAKKARLDINFEDPLEPDGDLAFTFLG